MGRCLLTAPSRIMGLERGTILPRSSPPANLPFESRQKILQSLNWFDNCRGAAALAVGKLNHHNGGKNYHDSNHLKRPHHFA